VSAGNLARPSGPSEVVVSRNPARPSDQRDIALIDLLDRLLDRGVVLAGDITLAVADIDLVYVGLRALLSSVAAAEREGMPLP
jgi:Gas vesicle protein